ncbi:phosphinothricin acetyltransferase [Catenuloplanes nepalensis]|uniref:Phosphinothricin acetyltransferase n=1 Tax=Catenuloplanes nepalensis TaxID=587533 RepID=A0ABT9MXK2_9ACTN|nr:GNAT family N-acetyltransferase [Catenuloplanes nepalensis]MDP9796162.1 phosphinothricin acetyltransferase [Catenuloplanes nepalensis]
MDVIIRAATAADLAAVAAVYAGYVTDSVATFEENVPSPADWRARHADLAARGLPFLVADDGGRIAGYAYAGPWRPKPAYRHTVEDTIYLDPAYTGRGIGSRLLAALLDASATAGARQMIAVIADTGTDASAALHRRHGFTDAGRLTAVGFKHGRWIDTILMQRTLR